MECAAKGLAAEPCFGGVADRRCGGCGAVAYCSRAHQVIHWRVHKEECKRFAEQMRRIDVLSQFPFTFLEPPALGLRRSYFSLQRLENYVHYFQVSRFTLSLWDQKFPSLGMVRLYTFPDMHVVLMRAAVVNLLLVPKT
ncbi:unnamed protein product [Miscanthus lutarioriparius]|uniref:MYND-type domain-containing protein n=1 Tax=Miscanthus lutarioriparius TaxID=422564 RepID=A0A811MYM9_9POAL|nr:unnamed protein product [Miscanthus lutarioriparius]